MARDVIRRYSLDTMRALRDQSKNRSKNRADAPAPPVDPDIWDSAKVVMPASGETSVRLRLDTDVLEWFKSGTRPLCAHERGVEILS